MQVLKNTPDFNNIKHLHPEVKAILWDMDGTIMETEELHILATIDLLKVSEPDSQISYKEAEQICMGNTDKMIYDILVQNYALKMTLDDFINTKNLLLSKMLTTIDKNSIFKSEIYQFMQMAFEAGIPQAVVTSSEKQITHELLEFLDLKKFFKFILTREDTVENKPSPMPYNTAIAKLGLKDQDTIIFEDSTTGLAAARSTGASVFQAKWYY